MNIFMKLAAVVVTSVSFATTIHAAEPIRLGVSFFPFYSADSTRPDILDVIAPDLAEQGYEVQKVAFLNYAEANPALAHGEIDGNLIQHSLYMDVFNKRAGADLVIVQPVYHATFALYSGTYADLAAIPEGETVIIPNDGVNTARALLLLQEAGLIKLADGAVYTASVTDIVDNPKELKFTQLPLTATAGAYDEGGRHLAVMYPTFARSLNLDGDQERLFVEPRNTITNQYAISFAVNAKDAENPKTLAVAKALHSDKAVEYLRENYGWASTPAD